MTAIAHAFDAVAERYDAVADGTITALVEDHEFARDFVARRPRGLVLDVGCGTGHLLDHVTIEPTDYVGVDVSAGMVRQARRKHPLHPFVVADMHTRGMIQPAATVFMGFDVFNLSPEPALLLDRIRASIYAGALVYALVTTPAHANAACACHEYTPAGARTFYTAEQMEVMFSRHFVRVDVRPLPSTPEHEGSYNIVTGYGRVYRDANDERPWRGHGG